MPTPDRRIPLLHRVPPGARRAMLVRVLGAALACALALVAVINPMLGLAAAVTVIVAAAYTQSTTFGVCAFVFVTYLDVITNYTGAALSPIKVCGGALIVVALLDLVTRARHGRGARRAAPTWSSHPVILMALIGFVAVGMASASWAVNVEQVRSLSERLVTEALTFVAIGVFLVRRGQLHALSCTALAAGVISTFYGMATGAESFGRALGTFTDPNEYAAAMVASIGLGFGAMGAARTATGRRLALVGILVCAYGILDSQSRGGLIAAVACAAVIVFSSRGREQVRMLGASGLVVAALLVVLVATPTGQQSLARITDGDSSGRSDLWRIAGEMFRDQPVHGVGLGNFPARSKDYITRDTEHTELINNGMPRTTHNSYLEIASELGLLGLLTFGTFAGGCLLLAMRAVRGARALDEGTVRVGRGIVAATVGVLASCIFLSNHYNELLWALLAGCLGFHALVVRQLRIARALDEAAAVVDNVPLEALAPGIDPSLLDDEALLELDAEPLALPR